MIEYSISNYSDTFAPLLTPDALHFVRQLEQRFGTQRLDLLAARAQRQKLLDAGGTLDFLPETQAIRDGDWKIAATPTDVQDRRVEITGPVDRKMVINALNSGAKVFMADFEDAHSPTWQGTLEGQINLRDAMLGTLDYVSPEGKKYQLDKHPAILMVRLRGIHLTEKNMLINGTRCSASLFDLGLFLYHNHQTAQKTGKGLYFYIPKTESHLEARWWNAVIDFAEDTLSIPRGIIKCTVLIETVTAAFEMDEIIYELKDHIIGLNAGRWDYIFNFIKRFSKQLDRIMPDRTQITMNTHFLRSYSQLLIKTCHKRGAHAMGGMAAFIPIKDDVVADTAAKDKVRQDKEREAGDGHDGTWVAHPGLVPVALAVFNEKMPTPNQIHLDLPVHHQKFTAADLLALPQGKITRSGMITNVNAGLEYIGAWLLGRGAVPIANLMEDAATAEISRAQLWQWIKSPKGILDTGQKITAELFLDILKQQLSILLRGIPPQQQGAFEQAAQLLQDLVLNDEFVEFLTIPAYEMIQ